RIIKGTDALEQLRAKQGRSGGRDRDYPRPRVFRAVEPALPLSPGAGGAADQVVSPVDAIPLRGAQDLASREPNGGFQGVNQASQPIRLGLDIAIYHRDEFRTASLDPRVYRTAESQVRA